MFYRPKSATSSLTTTEASRFEENYLDLVREIERTMIPLFEAQDHPICKGLDFENLSFKEAFKFLTLTNNVLPWSKM